MLAETIWAKDSLRLRYGVNLLIFHGAGLWDEFNQLLWVLSGLNSANAWILLIK